MNWVIDGLMSLVVLVGFILVYFIEAPYTKWIPYVDPVLVIILIVFSISIPIQIVNENWGQIVGKAPPGSEVDQARIRVDEVFATIDFCETHIRSGRFGRLFYIQIYVIYDQGHALTIDRQDAIREALYKIHFEKDESKLKNGNHIPKKMLKKANTDYFLTTDDGIIKKAKFIKNIEIVDPIDFIKEVSI